MTVWTEHEARDYAGHFHKAFPLKKDKQHRIKTLLNSHALNTPLEGKDLNAAIAVLAGHPDLTQKVGVGIAAVDIRPALHGTRCFHVIRADGSSTDFSYLKCLSAPTPRQEVHSACRNALKADHDLVKTYRLAASPFCELTGMPITAENSHVHHAPPMFDNIADSFAEQQGGHDVLAGRLERGDNVYGNNMNEDDRRAWLTWHGQRAVLQLVHRSANAHIEIARRNIRKGE